MSRDIIIAEVNRIFVESCISLFEGFGCKAHEIEADPADLHAAPFGYIDAGSDDLELTVALRMPLSVLMLTYPSMDGVVTADEETLEDWISEMTNQLIGKIKRHLLQHDCIIKIGLPMALFGADIEEAMPSGAEQRSTFLDVDHELCECRLAIEIFNEDMEFSAEAHETDSGNEGDLEFF